MRPCVAHLDIDAFFAAVEQRENPSLRGKALIVGGSAQSRSVVSSCSYEARRYGIHSAMPVARALRLCPHAVLRPVRMQRYQEYSKKLMTLLQSFAPQVHPASIDEAYLDFAGTEALYPSLEALLRKMKQSVKDQVGLTVSVGLATNWYVAKLASERDKPNGLCVVRAGEEASFVGGLAIEDLWGVGKRTRVQLQRGGIADLPALQRASRAELRRVCGVSSGSFLFAIARGEAPRSLRSTPKDHSISTERTLAKDIPTLEEAKPILMKLAQSLMHRLRKASLSGKAIRVKYRLHDFTTRSVQAACRTDDLSTYDIYSQACSLLKKRWREEAPLRLLGIAVTGVQKHSALQEDFFDLSRRRIFEEAIVSLTERFGDSTMQPARSIEKKNIDE